MLKTVRQREEDSGGGSGIRIANSTQSVPGFVGVCVNNPPMIPLGGKRTNSIYQYTLQTMDMAALVKYSQILCTKMRGLKELQGVNSNLTASSPQIDIKIDREKAATLGLTARDIESALSTSYAGRRVSWIYNNTDTYKVIAGTPSGSQR